MGELATCGMVLGGAALECDEGLECKFDDDCFYCTMGTCQKGTKNIRLNYSYINYLFYHINKYLI